MDPYPTLIPYNVPTLVGEELTYLGRCVEHRKFSGDGPFTKECSAQLRNLTSSPLALLTTSCTDALEMAALLLEISPDDEIISPSFTFVSAANAFALRGAKIVFVDIEPRTMNIDVNKIEAAITPRTKAIVIVHYAGVSCDMERLAGIAAKYNIAVVEDAAQALVSTYKGKSLGSIGDLGCISFHETKNLNCGEGGALLVNNADFFERAEIIREKGTNRTQYARGQVSKYNWLDLGSSFLMSELNAAFLAPQLLRANEITKQRLKIWDRYFESFRILESKGLIELPAIPEYASHNGHIFYIKLASEVERNRFIEHMKRLNILSVFHYVPLHSSPAGLKYSQFHGRDEYTTKESLRLARLPLFHSLTQEQHTFVISAVLNFFELNQ